MQRRVPIWLIAISILVPTSFASLATSATNVAIPYISGYFAATSDEAKWIVTSYMVANACMIMLSGWLENLFGRKPFLKISIAIFTLGALICTIAPSLNIMVLGRLVQGIGGGPMTPVAQTVLLSVFPDNKKGIAMSLFGFAVMVCAILGPSFGGFLVDNFNWHYIYSVNIPAGVISYLLISRNIEDTKHEQGKHHMDFVGMTALILWLLSMQIVLDKGQQYNWFDCAWICWLSGFSLVVLSFLIVWEIENKNSFMKIRLFKDRNFLIGTIISTTMSMIVFTTMYLAPQFIQNILGYTALLSGLSMAPRVISCVVMIFIIPYLMKIYDSRLLIAIGFFFLGLATYVYTNVNLDVSFLYVSIPNILLGVGVILTFIPVSTLALGTLPKEQLTNGASLHNFCKTIGMAVVVSMSSTIVARHSQMHQNYLVDNLSNFSLIFQNKMAGWIHTFISGASSTFAIDKANAYVYKQMITQSTLFAYVDTFAFVALFAFMLIPLSFFLKIKEK
ncbi:MAG: DHA2 family efflux MFS transporter permease subunit [Candidatus Gastranaerophilales bacterium]|nr:DHA2 family efflux MFS transporter permease subunit [Candidatus Gastranaerophilales bacterium]